MSNPKIQEIFDNYPEHVRPLLEYLRNLILVVANEDENIKKIEETLKWGEPSYLTRNGSTIRIDWKEKYPTQYAIYFKCTSNLVPTFREVFGGKFRFEGNRAILFQLNEKVPEEQLKICISAALTYHKRKKLPLLGLEHCI